MSKQDSSYLDNLQPMPSAPPSYDQLNHSAHNVQMDSSMHMPMPMPMNQATNAQPYQYQPVPVANEIPVQAPFPQQHVQYVQPQVHYPVAVGPDQVRTTCPSCHATIKTRIEKESSGSAHICCFLLCIFGCCLCSCLPYCMDSFQIVKHTCPNCKAYLGTYKRS